MSYLLARLTRMHDLFHGSPGPCRTIDVYDDMVWNRTAPGLQTERASAAMAAMRRVLTLRSRGELAHSQFDSWLTRMESRALEIKLFHAVCRAVPSFKKHKTLWEDQGARMLEGIGVMRGGLLEPGYQIFEEGLASRLRLLEPYLSKS